MTDNRKFETALKKIKTYEKKHKFDQTVDLIINLKNFDVRRESFNVFIGLPHKIKDKKVTGFFEKKSKNINTITKDQFGNYKEKKDIRKLLKNNDFFIANAKLMPSVATNFGRVLGPAGKMPSPQLGILPNEDEKLIQSILEKINSTVRVRVKEPSIKIAVARESQPDKDIVDNLVAAYNNILDKLPKNNENVKDVKIKLTMGKPEQVEL